MAPHRLHARAEETRPLSILVTGGAGYIGSHMVLELIDAGRPVVVLDDLSTGFAEAVPAGSELIVGDSGDRTLLADLLARRQISAVIHFAAKAVVPDSVADPLGYYEANTVKSQALIAATVEAGIKTLIFSSTAAVYGDVGDEPANEDAPKAPQSPYGRSKLMTEWMIEDAARAHGLGYAILRYFNVAGADPAGRAGQSTAAATHLIKAACQAALGVRPQLVVYGADFPTRDGTGVRDYIQVSDLAAAHRSALEHLERGGPSLTLNCGYGGGFSVLEVVETVKAVSGADFPVILAGCRPGDPASIVADVARIRRKLTWEPRYAELEVMVRQALDWERKLAAG